MKTPSKAHIDGYREGYADAMLQAAKIADSHRAMQRDYGNTEGSIAASSVAAFIIQAARDAGAWDESIKQPLVLARDEAAAE